MSLWPPDRTRTYWTHLQGTPCGNMTFAQGCPNMLPVCFLGKGWHFKSNSSVHSSNSPPPNSTSLNSRKRGSSLGKTESMYADTGLKESVFKGVQIDSQCLPLFVSFLAFLKSYCKYLLSIEQILPLRSQYWTLFNAYGNYLENCVTERQREWLSVLWSQQAPAAQNRSSCCTSTRELVCNPLNQHPPRASDACSARSCSTSGLGNSLCNTCFLAKGSNGPATSSRKGVWLCPPLNSPSGRFSGLLPSHF